MLVERIEHKWLAAFTRTFTLCQVQPGEVVAILAETQSRRVNVDLARLALEGLGARVFEVTLTTPALTAPAPVRSTGASDAIAQLTPVVASLARADFVVDCTVEGLLHAPELPAILQGADGKRPRLLMVSNEHPEILERTVPDPALEGVVRSAMKKLKGAQQMHVTSVAGTDTLVILACGASSRRVCASAGKNIISPKSDNDTRQCMSLVLWSNASRPLMATSNCCSWACTSGAMRSHKWVGLRP